VGESVQRVFLRRGEDLLDITGREVTIGRSRQCDIALLDDLISRRHCRVEAFDIDTLCVVDLGSRNGVLVNGLPVSGRQTLFHGDLLVVGSHQLEIRVQTRAPRGRAVRDGDGRDPSGESGSITRTGNVFEMLFGGARVALATGDLNGAETSVRNLFSTVRGYYLRGQDLDDVKLEQSLDLALELADVLGEVSWLDRLFDLLLVARRTPPTHVIVRIQHLSARLGRPARLASYLAGAEGFARVGDPALRALRAIDP
jgi:hypothetical protein